MSEFKIGDVVTISKQREGYHDASALQPGERAVVSATPDMDGDYDLEFARGYQFAHESTVVAYQPFKIGDRVRVTNGHDAHRDYFAGVETGEVGTVRAFSTSDSDTCPIEVWFDDQNDSWWMNARHMERVTEPAARIEFTGGGMRDTQEGKPRFDLLLPERVPFDEQFLTRFAVHMAKGAEKYEDRNWEQFSDEEALARAKASALRHMMQWQAGETDEDHAAAVAFNLMAAEYVQGRIDGRF